MRLPRELVEELHPEAEADGGEGAASEEAIEVAAAVAEADAVAVESEAEHEHGLDGSVDRLCRHFRSPARRLLQAERESAKRARVRVNVEKSVARIGPRHEELLARRAQTFDEPPGIDLVAEREASQDPTGADDLGQREDAFGDPLRSVRGSCRVDLPESCAEALTQRGLGCWQ